MLVNTAGSSFERKEQNSDSKSGLPDFSWYNIQKGENIPK
jgi:hypothetical protein